MNHPHPIYRNLARLSIAVGILSTAAAVVFTAAYEIIVPPHDPYRTDFLSAGLGQISFFALIVSIGPVAFAQIHPASRRLAKLGLLWSILPFFAGVFTMILTEWIVRRT